jgi:hypothetical protein
MLEYHKINFQLNKNQQETQENYTIETKLEIF